MSKKIKKNLLLIGSFIILNIVIYNIIEINKEQRIDFSLEKHLDKLKTHYNILIYHQKITAHAAYQSTINKKDVINILKKTSLATPQELDILRQKLFEKLKDKYKILKYKGVLQYHFVLPNNRVFLRMHKPEKYGDSLKNIRYSFEYTNKYHKQISGFEQGKTSHGFRNVYPIFDENKNYLASLEISFSSDFLQEYLINVSKIHTHFLVDKHIFDVKAWSRDDMILQYQQSSENKDFMMSIIHSDYKKEHIIENRKRLKGIKRKIYKNMKKEEAFSIYTVYKEKTVVISFYPIKNIKEKKTVAWIVSYDKDAFIDMAVDTNSYAQLAMFLLLFIIFYFLYRTINQKEILDIQVKKQTEALAKSEQSLKLLNENLEQRIKEEVKKNQEKDTLLFQQSKMASMGEMIGNIAHQWRQPIAIISMWANNIIADIDMEEVENESLKKYANHINEQTVHLSKTIDDFRNFFAPNKEKKLFSLKSSIDKTLELLSASFKVHNIEVIQNIEDIEIITLQNELTQAILNIIKNSKDIITVFNENGRKLIFINVYKKDKNVVIEIIDNGGGIPKNIMQKIFDPYFTTKHKSQGTGIGLYMTQSIITKHLNGTIDVQNSEYVYDGKNYKGAKFQIKLHLISKASS